MSFYVSTATFYLLHCDEWDRVVALPRHKFVTGATLLQLRNSECKLAHIYGMNKGKVFMSCVLYTNRYVNVNE